MDGYIDFRFALKEAEIASRELLEKHTADAREGEAGTGRLPRRRSTPPSATTRRRSRLELTRDEARNTFEKEDRTYQLLKDITENLSIGYDVGETLVTKLKQTHDVKDRVYRRAVTFFTTNEHVFTILGTVYTSQHGLHEATQATEALKEGVNKGLEDVAELGRELERAALKAGYGSTINPESVQKLVDAITDFQVESLQMIAELRKESEANAKEIRRVVEDGKRRYQETLAKFAAGREGVNDSIGNGGFVIWRLPETRGLTRIEATRNFGNSTSSLYHSADLPLRSTDDSGFVDELIIDFQHAIDHRLIQSQPIPAQEGRSGTQSLVDGRASDLPVGCSGVRSSRTRLTDRAAGSLHS